MPKSVSAWELRQIRQKYGVNEIPEWGFWCRGEYYAMDRCRGCSNKRPVCCFCERKETRCGEYCSVRHKYIKSRCTNNLCPDFTRKAPLINYCPTCGRPLEEEVGKDEEDVPDE